MADDRHYVPGDFYRICDRTGFKVRAGRTHKEWTGHIVRAKSSEPRHSQDFVRGVKDDQNVPDPRSRPLDVFLGPLGTTLSVSATAGATILTIGSSVRMLTGDTVAIMLDDNTMPRFTIIVNSSTQITVSRGLPYRASAGNEVIDWTAYSQPSIG